MISMGFCYSSSVLVRFFREAVLVLCLTVRWLLLPCYSWRPSPFPSSPQDKTEAEARARHRAAAREVRESLRVSAYGDLVGEQEEEDSAAGGAASCCAVCLSEVGRRDSVRELRNCGHVFHRGCLDRWLDHDERLSCPLCRAPLLSRRLSGYLQAPVEPSWAVERLLYLFGDDVLVAPPLPCSSPRTSTVPQTGAVC